MAEPKNVSVRNISLATSTIVSRPCFDDDYGIRITSLPWVADGEKCQGVASVRWLVAPKLCVLHERRLVPRP